MIFSLSAPYSWAFLKNQESWLNRLNTCELTYLSVIGSYITDETFSFQSSSNCAKIKYSTHLYISAHVMKSTICYQLFMTVISEEGFTSLSSIVWHRWHEGNDRISTGYLTLNTIFRQDFNRWLVEDLQSWQHYIQVIGFGIIGVRKLNTIIYWNWRELKLLKLYMRPLQINALI